MKKVLSIILALALCGAMATCAFATDADLEVPTGEEESSSGSLLPSIEEVIEILKEKVDIEDLKRVVTETVDSLSKILDIDVNAPNFSITDIAPQFMETVIEKLKEMGVDTDALLKYVEESELINFFAKLYTGGVIPTKPATTEAPTETTTVKDNPPMGGAAIGGLAAFAVLSVAAAAAYVCSKKE